MIREIKALLDKYNKMQQQNYESVLIGQVTCDLHRLLGDARIKRLPKGER